MARAHERKGRGNLLFRCSKLAAQHGQLALGDELEMVARDFDRGV